MIKIKDIFYKFPKFKSLSTKIITGIIIFIIIPVCFMFFYSFNRYAGIINIEMSERNVDDMSRIEGEINNVFDNMIKVSNFIVNDTSIEASFLDNGKSYYEKNKDLNTVFSSVTDSGIFKDDIIITIFDNNDNVYSNWSLNFNDYSQLLNKEWVQQAIKSKGHLIWSSFESSYIKEEEDKKKNYISLSRTIISNNGSGKDIGMLILSVRESEFENIFLKYIKNEDGCMLVSKNQNKVLVYAGNKSLVKENNTEKVESDILSEGKGYILKFFNNKQYLVNTYTIKVPWIADNDEWRIITFTLYDRIIQKLQGFSYQIILLFGIFVSCLIIISVFLTRSIVSPIKKLGKQMVSFNIDSKFATLDVDRQDEIGHLNKAFYKMAESIKDLFNQIAEEYEIKEKYKFESLRAQLNPHFLFNTLNTIRWMAIIRKADNIVESIDALCTLLKFSMSRGSEIVDLNDELENIKSYIFIQNTRYGSMYKIKYDIDKALLKQKVIKFILQPIVENAIVHAFKNKEVVGVLEISAKVEDEKLILLVKDNGIGMSDEKIKGIFMDENNKNRDDSKVTGLGIKNVNERIKVAYGSQYKVEIMSKEGEGTTVKYTLPQNILKDDENAEDTHSR